MRKRQEQLQDGVRAEARRRRVSLGPRRSRRFPRLPLRLRRRRSSGFGDRLLGLRIATFDRAAATRLDGGPQRFGHGGRVAKHRYHRRAHVRKHAWKTARKSRSSRTVLRSNRNARRTSPTTVRGARAWTQDFDCGGLGGGKERVDETNRVHVGFFTFVCVVFFFYLKTRLVRFSLTLRLYVVVWKSYCNVR